ncbi:MAG: hypothetical protein AAF322_07875 [Pseudomonadota bacterium]
MNVRPEDRRGAKVGGPWFAAWLGSTLLLAGLSGALWWFLETREAQVVQVTGPTPPPPAPSEEQSRRAAELRSQVATRQAELGEKIAALDPPRCKAGRTIDFAALEAARRETATDIAGWRALLAPSPEPGAGPVRRIVR